MEQIHFLKLIQPYFEESWNRVKTFEVRKNDRNFKKNDIVFLKEYDPTTDNYSGRELKCTILYVLDEFTALKEDYVVFSFSIDLQIDYLTKNKKNEFGGKKLLKKWEKYCYP